MDPSASVVECENAHIGGAKSIRLNTRRQPRRSVPPFGIGSNPSILAMMPVRIAVRCAGCRLWKAHPVVRDCTMIDWDDIRYFLAVARGGSRSEEHTSELQSLMRISYA